MKITEWHSFHALGCFKGFMQQVLRYSYNLLIHSLFIYLITYIRVCLCAFISYVHYMCAKACKGQVRAMNLLELELQIVLWVLGTEATCTLQKQ